MRSETSTKVTGGGASGATCNASAPYTCNTHTDTVLFVRKGQKYPNCPISRSKKGHTTTWIASNEEVTKAPSPIDQLDSVAI